jgi:dTDP-4-amino-4,6-dideoxygalactose transaminase
VGGDGAADGEEESTVIPIAKPMLGEEEAEAAREAILSGWVTQGPRVRSFEEAFAAAVGARHACAVSNGTAALHLALLAVGVKPGDVVLTVSHSFIASANAARFCGAEPVFVDIDPQTYNMDANLFARCLDEDFRRAEGGLWYRHAERLAVEGSPLHRHGGPLGRLAAIMVVHQGGMPADLGRILPLARERGIPVVEDAACAIGSEISLDGGKRWERLGRPHGEVACFSFHPRKVLTTGDGGMLTTDDAGYDRVFRLLRHQGMSVSDLDRHRSDDVIFEDYPITGFNYRMTDIQAAVGIEQLKRLPHILSRRRALGSLYSEGFAGVPNLRAPEEPPYARTNWQSYIVRLLEPLDQRAVMKALQDRGIAARRGVMCAHLEEPYAGAWKPGDLPYSEVERDQSIVLPLFPEMTGDEATTVVRNLIEIVDR